MGIFFLLILNSVFANCELGGGGNDFHTIATYAASSEHSKSLSSPLILDGHGFLFDSSAQIEVQGVKGINCPNFSQKYVGAEKSVRSYLRLSGCDESALKSSFMLYKGYLTKINRVVGEKIKPNDDEIKRVKTKIHQSGLLGNIHIANVLAPDTGTQSLELVSGESKHVLTENMDGYDFTDSVSFTFFGKKMNWYLFTAKARYRLLTLGPVKFVRYGVFERKRDKEVFYDEPLPLVVYEYDDKMNYFGNGIHGTCEMDRRVRWHDIVEDYTEDEIKGQNFNKDLPAPLPHSAFEIYGVTDEIMLGISRENQSAAYLWNLSSGGFRVLRD